MNVAILFSPDTDDASPAATCLALVGYLSRTYHCARSQHVRVDTVDGRRFVVMDTPVTDSEAHAYGLIRRSTDAFLAGWRARDHQAPGLAYAS